MTTAVRRLPGPFATRVCVPSPGGYAWREDGSGGLTGLLGAEELAALARIVPQDPCEAIVPRVADEAVVWATVPTERLAFDVVFGAADPSYGDAVHAFRRLGRYLARLHGTVVPAALADLQCGCGPRVHPRDLTLRAERDAARDRLAAELGVPTDSGPRPVDPVLLHGRFSLGVIAWGTRPVVLGWREAGTGPAEADVDTLLSELAEAAAYAPPRTAWLSDLGGAFIQGYALGGRLWPGFGGDLAARLYARALDHMALRTAVTGDRVAPLAFLRRVRERLDEFCAQVMARSTVPEGSSA